MKNEKVVIAYLLEDAEAVKPLGNDLFEATDLFGDVQTVSVKYGYSEFLGQNYAQVFNENGSEIGIVHYE